MTPPAIWLNVCGLVRLTVAVPMTVGALFAVIVAVNVWLVAFPLGGVMVTRTFCAVSAELLW